MGGGGGLQIGSRQKELDQSGFKTSERDEDVT
jgi:hypothetical protein